VIKQLGLIPAGGNYVRVPRRIEELGLDTGHFTGKGWSARLRFGPNPHQPLDQLLLPGSSVQSYKLKMRLIQAGILEAGCQWRGWAKVNSSGTIPVELDHINGDNTDNRIENLHILCPNCHSMTPTYRRRKSSFA
jgi:hypothetical protein